MKILVMNLLRLGDIAMSSPALLGLRRKYPDAEIHLLINRQCEPIIELLPSINQFHFFERELLQRGLGEYESPFFSSYERLTRLLDELNSQSFDLKINFTQNRLSGWLMSVIDARESLGLCFDERGLASFGANWFRFLNMQIDSEGREAFHFADVFRFSVGLEFEHSSAALTMPSNARAEAERAWQEIHRDVNGFNELVCVQPLTSDAKKNWSLASYKKTIQLFSSRHPQAAVAILAAPFEIEKLQSLADELKREGVKARLCEISLAGAFCLLHRAQALLTGDTSIKHLAAQSPTKVVEIAIGSADPYRTGPYAHGSLIIRSKEECAPCSHSGSCHRTAHFCAQGVSPEMVAMVLSEAVSGRSFQLRAIAEEYRSEAELYVTDMRSAGFWTIKQVGEDFTEANVSRWIDLACRKLWLNQDREQNFDQLGSEVHRLIDFLKRSYPQTSDIEWRHLLSDFERQVNSIEGRLNGFRVELRNLMGRFEDPRRMHDFVRGLISLKDKMRGAPLLNSFRSLLDRVIEDDISPPFTRMRRITDVISELDRRTTLHLRLVRGLSLQLGENLELEKT